MSNHGSFDNQATEAWCTCSGLRHGDPLSADCPTHGEDPEQFCSTCYAGTESVEHHQKCAAICAECSAILGVQQECDYLCSGQAWIDPGQATTEDELREEVRRLKADVAALGAAHMYCHEEHCTRWHVLSDDGHRYAVNPNTREEADRNAMLLRQPDEDGHCEPTARVVEERICAWSRTRLLEPRGEE